MTITENTVQAINVALLDIQRQIDELKKMIQEVLENTTE